MIYLYRIRGRELGVWDGKLGHVLDKEKGAVSEVALEEAPPRAIEGEIAFEDKAFCRYVAMKISVAEALKGHEWLEVILESARELDLLTDAFLSGVDCVSHQADLSTNSAENLTWHLSHAKFDRSMRARCQGELLRWPDLKNQLLIFNGVEDGGYPVIQVWYGNPPTSCIGYDRQQPEVPENSAETELTWDEAIHLFKKWGRDVLRFKPYQNVAPVATMVLQHRRKRFITALCLAKSKHGGDGDPTKQTTDKNFAQTLQRMTDLEDELKIAKQENESLACAGDTSEKEFSSAVQEIKRLKGMVTDLMRENENLKNHLSSGQRKKNFRLFGGGRAPHDSTRVPSESNSDGNDSSELLIVKEQARKLKEDLENANLRMARLDEECGKLRREVAQYRAHRSRVTSGESGVNVAASSEDLPSSIAVAGEVIRVSSVLMNDVYFDHGQSSRKAQDGFGKAIVWLLREMYILTREHYVGLFESMLQALGGLETRANVTAYTLEAFEVYCKTHWNGLFLNLRDGVVVPSVCTDTRGIVAHELPDAQLEKVQSRALISDEVMDWTPSNQPENSSQKGTPLESLQKLFFAFLGHFPFSSPEKRKRIFDELWKLTVVMFLQRPHKRFSFSERISSLFDSRCHEYVDSTIKAGQQCVLLIPGVFEAPHDFAIMTASIEACNDDSEWLRISKCHVDSPVP